MTQTSVLAQRFRSFATASASRAPLYQRLAAEIADDPSVLALLQSAPDEQAIPVLLFAAVHHLLLDGDGAELAAWYPNLTARPREDDPYPTFRTFVSARADVVRSLLATRHTQTNEVGRCALALPALGMVERETGQPLSLVEVGASAGLNLLLDRYAYTYRPGGDVGEPSNLLLGCDTRGDVPVPARIPPVAAAIGLDARPVDVRDPDGVRWLEACVWPDQIDRFQRLVEAIALARTDPPTIRTGDAVDDLASTVRPAAASGHPVVLTSWVLNYLSEVRQTEFVAVLDAIGADIDLSWVALESPAQTPGLPIPARSDGEDLTVLSLTRWRNGSRSVERLATCHPHGYWVHWEDRADRA